MLVSPVGGNLLFLGGQVDWTRSGEAELGCNTGGWRCYCKIGID